MSTETWHIKEIEGGGSYRYRQENLNYGALRDKVESLEGARIYSRLNVTLAKGKTMEKILRQ